MEIRGGASAGQGWRVSACGGAGQVRSRGGVKGESYIAGFDVGISPDL